MPPKRTKPSSRDSGKDNQKHLRERQKRRDMIQKRWEERTLKDRE